MVAKDYISNPRMGSILQPKVYLPATSTSKSLQATDKLHMLQQKVLEQRTYYDEEETQEPDQLDNFNLVEMFRNEDRLKNGRSLEIKPKRKSYDESKSTFDFIFFPMISFISQIKIRKYVLLSKGKNFPKG